MLTVLVADDEFAVLEVLSMALEGEGHRVLKAGDGADALRILSTQPCDVVVCDEKMPVMSGRQLIDAMHAEPRLARFPVIMMAESWGRAAPADRRRGRARQADPARGAVRACRPRSDKARRQP